jgi:NADPH:quinone reductase-like Zn-dependent oxidoreductase
MRAAFAHSYGAPSVITLATDVPMPIPGPEQLLIRVHSTTVNPADCKQRSGNLKLVMKHSFPLAFGQDFAGIVESAPPTSQFKRGDEVYGCTAPRNGCGAEYVAVYEREVVRKPVTLAWDVAAATPTAACTAYRGVVTVGKATEGMRVLVHGASGGVGSAMVQIARRGCGCTVWGTSGPTNRQYVLRAFGHLHFLESRSTNERLFMNCVCHVPLFTRVLTGATLGASLWTTCERYG